MSKRYKGYRISWEEMATPAHGVERVEGNSGGAVYPVVSIGGRKGDCFW